MIPGWREQAACVGADPRMFDPPERSEPTQEIRDRIEAVNFRYCSKCPVQQECVDSITKEDHGIRAGAMFANGKPLAIRDVYKAKPSKPTTRQPAHPLDIGQYPDRDAQRQAVHDARVARIQEINSRQVLLPCGTVAAYRRHITRREPVDDACRKANTERMREYRNVSGINQNAARDRRRAQARQQQTEVA